MSWLVIRLRRQCSLQPSGIWPEVHCVHLLEALVAVVVRPFVLKVLVCFPQLTWWLVIKSTCQVLSLQSTVTNTLNGVFSALLFSCSILTALCKISSKGKCVCERLRWSVVPPVFFSSTTTKTMTKMMKTFGIIVDETKTKTKMKTKDDNDIKINSILVLTTLTRISKATFGTSR